MSTEHSKKELLSTPIAILLGSVIIGFGLFAGLLANGSGSGTGNTSQDIWEGGAKFADVNKRKLEQCIESNKYDAKVSGDLQAGQSIGVSGTPTAFVIAANGTQYRISGAQPAEVVKGLIDKALAGTPSSDPQVALPAVTDSERALGDANAPITIVEYSDLECPFCARFHTTKEIVMNDYAGKVKWVHRHFPLEQIHPNARTYAQAVECAGEIGGNDAYWKMIDFIFKNQPK